MAARADRELTGATIVAYTVDTGETVAVGDTVKYGDADHEVALIAAVTDKPIGVVYELGALDGAAGDVVMVALLTGGVVPVKLAGTATRGHSAKYSTTSGRLANAVEDVATASVAWSPGYFTQSGVSGDLVGLALCRHFLTE